MAPREFKDALIGWAVVSVMATIILCALVLGLVAMSS